MTTNTLFLLQSTHKNDCNDVIINLNHMTSIMFKKYSECDVLIKVATVDGSFKARFNNEEEAKSVIKQIINIMGADQSIADKIKFYEEEGSSDIEKLNALKALLS